jgi:cysteine desulfurase
MTTNRITVAHSPDSDDAFMFYEALLMALSDIAASTGSACASGSQAPSHVLEAIGAVSDRGGASIRFGLGRPTTDADIDYAIERVTAVVKSLRASRVRV